MKRDYKNVNTIGEQHSLFFFFYIILRGRKHVNMCACTRRGGEDREGEREYHAGSAPSAQSPKRCSNPQTIRSWPKLRSRVGHSTDWTTQAHPTTQFLKLFFSLENSNFWIKNKMLKQTVLDSKDKNWSTTCFTLKILIIHLSYPVQKLPTKKLTENKCLV